MKRILFFLLLFSSFAKAQTKTGDIYLRPQYNVLKYGAMDDSTTDCRVAFKAAIAAASADGGGNVFVPSTKMGFYISDSIIIPGGVNIVGVQGLSNQPSKIISKSSTKSIFVATSSTAVVGLYNLWINYQGTSRPTNGAGFRCNSSGGTGVFNIKNCWIAGFWIDIDVVNGQEWTIADCTISYPIQYGISVGNSIIPDLGDWVITNCYFSSAASAFSGQAYAGLYWHGSGGAKITNCKWNAGSATKSTQFKYDMVISAIDGTTSDFSVANCSFENYDSSAIYGLSTNIFRSILLTNIQTFGNVPKGSPINLGFSSYSANSGSITISNFVIAEYSGSPSQAAMNFTNANYVTIGKGVIRDYTGGITTSGCTNVSTDPALNTAGQVSVAQSGGSSDLTFSGNVLTVNDGVSIGNHSVATGINPVFSNPNNVASYAISRIYPGSGTNVANQFTLIPKGTGTGGVRSAIAMFGTDFIADATNYSLFIITHTGSAATFLSTSAGSGTRVPISLTASALTDQLKLNIDGSSTFFGQLGLAASTTTIASLNIPSGTAPTSPVNGDIWSTSTNHLARLNGTSYTMAKTLTGSATLDFPSTGSTAVADLTITVTGAAVGDPVSLGVPNGSVTTTATFTAWVSATNTVTVRFSPKATEDPASGTFKATVIPQ